MCRGLKKEKMRSVLHLRAAMEVGQGVHRRKLDLEEFHDRSECNISQCLLNKLIEGKS